MQTRPEYARGSAWRTATAFVRAEGPLALYRGLLPPLIGSSIFRSIQFAAYGWCMAHTRDSVLASAIPGTSGLEWRVMASGIIAATARSVVETPLEFVKVRRQIGVPWLLRGGASALSEVQNIYSGFGVSWLRTVGLMTLFFVQVDILERHYRDAVEIPGLGPFLKGQCATTAWIAIWPAEVSA